MGYKSEDGGFSSLGEFLSRVRKVCDGELNDNRLKTAGHMETGDDSQGGFLVPEQWADGIFHAALEGAIVRPRVGDAAFRIKGDSLKVRKFKESDRSSNIFGGITFNWTAEAATKEVSKPAIGECELTPHKLVGSCFVTNELEDDYGTFGDFMKIAFGQAIRFIEDDYFINGSGVGQPLGILNSNALIPVPRQALGEIEWRDISRMVNRLLPDSWERAVWLINPEALEKLFDSAAVGALQVPVLDMSKRTIWGCPFIVTEKCQALGTLGDIILADFGVGHYLIADKELEISGSRHVHQSNWLLQEEYFLGFVTDETFWRVVLRVDGQPLMDAPLTPLRGGNTVSPFVALDVPTS